MASNEVERSRIERTLTEALCNASDNGGVELLEAASYSTGELARMLSAHRERKSSPHTPKTLDYAQPRGSRCLCPACASDYRVMAALG